VDDGEPERAVEVEAGQALPELVAEGQHEVRDAPHVRGDRLGGVDAAELPARAPLVFSA